MEKQPLRCMLLHPIYFSDLTILEASARQLEKTAITNNNMFGLIRVGMLIYIIIDTPIDDVYIELKKNIKVDHVLIDITEGLLEGDLKYKMNNDELSQLKTFFESIQKAGQILKKESGNFTQTINQLKNESNSIPYYEKLSVPKAIDIILDKIGKNGVDSLDDGERNFLNKHSN